jgi:hypothetical protein
MEHFYFRDLMSVGGRKTTGSLLAFCLATESLIDL